MKELVERLKANFPLLSITTPEEGRVELSLARVAVETKRKLYRWTITKGLEEFSTVDGSWAKTSLEAEGDPNVVARVLGGRVSNDDINNAIIAILDFLPYLKDPVVVRSLRDALPLAKDRFITGVFVGAQLDLPPELKREVSEVELPLPTEAELQGLIEATVEANKTRKDLVRPEGAGLTRLVESARGLTMNETENALALSLVSTRQLSHAVISKEKARAIKASGALEILEPPSGGLDAVGGLSAVKEWIRTRGRAFSPEAKAYGLPNPKGALLTGVPGTGKSLAAKAAAATLQIPLVRLDVGAIFGGLVGESEANIRSALKTLDAVAPCVCMIDEFEKAFSGSSGKSGDSGTSARVLGHFLTWTQEHSTPVFLIATANDVTFLPPEILRRGRWDTMMFVDLPSADERADIFRIHITNRKRDVNNFDIASLAELAKGFSGAEIEQCVVESMFNAFADNGRELTTKDVANAVRATVPLSRTMSTQIDSLREWASTRCVSASGATIETPKAPSAGRKVS